MSGAWGLFHKSSAKDIFRVVFLASAVLILEQATLVVKERVEKGDVKLLHVHVNHLCARDSELSENIVLS